MRFDFFPLRQQALSYPSRSGNGYGNQKKRSVHSTQFWRGEHATSMDAKFKAPIAKNPDQWKKDPAHFDLEGIDTPSSVALNKIIGQDHFAQSGVQDLIESGKTSEQALKIYFDSTEGDFTQLPIEYVLYADKMGWPIKNKPHWFGELRNVPDLPDGHEWVVKADYKGETQTTHNFADHNEVARYIYNSRGRYDNIRVSTRPFKAKWR